MRRTFVAFFLLGWMSIVCSDFLQAQDPFVDYQGEELLVEVKQEDGTMVHDAEVVLLDTLGKVLAQAKYAEEQQLYHFDEIPEGAAKLRIKKPPFRTQTLNLYHCVNGPYSFPSIILFEPNTPFFVTDFFTFPYRSLSDTIGVKVLASHWKAAYGIAFEDTIESLGWKLIPETDNERRKLEGDFYLLTWTRQSKKRAGQGLAKLRSFEEVHFAGPIVRSYHDPYHILTNCIVLFNPDPQQVPPAERMEKWGLEPGEWDPFQQVFRFKFDDSMGASVVAKVEKMRKKLPEWEISHESVIRQVVPVDTCWLTLTDLQGNLFEEVSIYLVNGGAAEQWPILFDSLQQKWMLRFFRDGATHLAVEKEGFLPFKVKADYLQRNQLIRLGKPGTAMYARTWTVPLDGNKLGVWLLPTMVKDSNRKAELLQEANTQGLVLSKAYPPNEPEDGIFWLFERPDQAVISGKQLAWARSLAEAKVAGPLVQEAEVLLPQLAGYGFMGITTQQIIKLLEQKGYSYHKGHHDYFTIDLPPSTGIEILQIREELFSTKLFNTLSVQWTGD